MKRKFNTLSSILKLIETMDAHPVGGALFIRLVAVCLGGSCAAVIVVFIKSLFG
ncbi:MAG: hypothetical protein GTN84_20905 [Hydrogenophaga sp.]|uniref:hypothetical protein n=1 Tax=Hydrogenophaga sp. TaxID=1904254 RepID=UPI0016B5E347|nr:hypothetical protein [Hydrogenophaga sp.]NIM43702.1 hypothetical protein [Hydrogenophaga sp.]NIN28771.1 hypothetical protein [Hydrogenophaga sp.]NIN33230.1 hypothetical protein [Hydrogenophaga sp.]NIN57905.1 hypothetical protein [Hydrogenophaga sp.]NIO54200.1 hypothetical protein [Hydrogenophaga sp.]